MNKKSTPKTLSSKREQVFTIALFLISLIIIFLAAETFIRITSSHINLWVVTGREAGRNPMEEWALVDAFSAYTGRPGIYGKKKKTINKYGFISTPEISINNDVNTIRIVFLGASSTAGTGYDLADEATWPWKVTEILRKDLRKNKIEFINAALGGYTTFESFGRFWSRIRFFSPDIIVLYHGWNEMYYFNKGANLATRRTLPDGSWGFSNGPQITIYEPYWFDHLIRYSQFLTKIRLRLSIAKDGEVGLSKELKYDYNKNGLDVFRTNLCLIREAASIFGTKLFVAKQATLIVPDLNEVDRNRCNYNFHGFNHDAHVDAFNQIYHIIDQEIEADNIIDVTQISGVSEYFYDHVHPTEIGSSEIAKIVAKSIKPYVTIFEKDQLKNN